MPSMPRTYRKAIAAALAPFAALNIPAVIAGEAVLTRATLAEAAMSAVFGVVVYYVPNAKNPREADTPAA